MYVLILMLSSNFLLFFFRSLFLFKVNFLKTVITNCTKCCYEFYDFVTKYPTNKSVSASL